VVKYNINFFIYRPFFRNRLQVRPVDRCSRVVAFKNVKSLRDVPFGVITLISVSNFYAIAKTVEIWSKTGLYIFFRFFFDCERLTMKLFKSKVPLMFIVVS